MVRHIWSMSPPRQRHTASRARPGAFACCRHPKKHGAQALGRSRGGFGSKVHCVADALGNPIAFTVTGAEQADITQALLEKVSGAQCVTADKGYDSDALVSAIEQCGAQAIIPPRSNRKILRVGINRSRPGKPISAWTAIRTQSAGCSDCHRHLRFPCLSGCPRGRVGLGRPCPDKDQRGHRSTKPITYCVG